MRVERRLYQSACGYSFNSVKIFIPARAVEPIYAPYVEHIPPDTTAAIFWLTAYFNGNGFTLPCDVLENWRERSS